MKTEKCPMCCDLQEVVDELESTAREFARSLDYYRSLLERCGEAIGEEAYTADDGSKPGGILVAKVPELVERLASRNRPRIELFKVANTSPEAQANDT